MVSLHHTLIHINLVLISRSPSNVSKFWPMVSPKPYDFFTSFNENYHRVASFIKLRGHYDLQRIATDLCSPVSLNTAWIKYMTDALSRSYSQDLTAMPPEAAYNIR